MDCFVRWLVCCFLVDCVGWKNCFASAAVVVVFVVTAGTFSLSPPLIEPIRALLVSIPVLRTEFAVTCVFV